MANANLLADLASGGNALTPVDTYLAAQRGAQNSAAQQQTMDIQGQNQNYLNRQRGAADQQAQNEQHLQPIREDLAAFLNTPDEYKQQAWANTFAPHYHLDGQKPWQEQVLPFVHQNPGILGNEASAKTLEKYFAPQKQGQGQGQGQTQQTADERNSQLYSSDPNFRKYVDRRNTADGGARIPANYERDPNDPTRLRAMPGGPKDPANLNLNQSNTQRQQLVVGSAKNALDRLAEIQKNHPDAVASNFLGVEHAGIVSNTVYQAGRAITLDENQRNADSGYAALVDEAIPVFTGGLRGSDAFRRFLIEQLPKTGDNKKNRDEKLRLFAENIKGIRDTFARKAEAAPDAAPAEAAPAQQQGQPRIVDW